MISEVFAPAKINLTLHVTGQRADGYHLLDSLVVFTDEICDRLSFAPQAHLSLEVTGPFAAGVPTDNRNLVWRAAEAVGYKGRIRLEKNLPHGAGIGGGSADAAAVLRRDLLQTGALDFAPEHMSAADQLGADVRVCLETTPQRMRGIGEVLSKVPSLPHFDLVLVNPGVEVPTASVFKALEDKHNPPMPTEIPSFKTCAEMCGWLSEQRNDLETPARGLFPRIDQALEALGDAALARMSGSGATCFGIYPDGTAAAARIRQAHPEWWVQRSGIGTLGAGMQKPVSPNPA